MSYILTRSTSIEHTHRCVEALAEAWGSKLELPGDIRYTFPSPQTLVSVWEPQLRDLDPAFRFPAQQSESIVQEGQLVLSGILDWDRLAEGSYAEAVRMLTGIRGVGDKIADCVALMALDKLEAFPVDLWGNRALDRWYKDSPTSRGDTAIARWAYNRFAHMLAMPVSTYFTGLSKVKAELSLDPHLPAIRARIRPRYRIC